MVRVGATFAGLGNKNVVGCVFSGGDHALGTVDYPAFPVSLGGGIRIVEVDAGAGFGISQSQNLAFINDFVDDLFL